MARAGPILGARLRHPKTGWGAGGLLCSLPQDPSPSWTKMTALQGGRIIQLGI